MKIIDLHVHTTASDGTNTFDEIVDLAKEKMLSAIAITDHDTMDAVNDDKVDGIEIVPGIEFSTKYKSKLHILGYYIDKDNKQLKTELKSIVDDRNERNEKVVEAMREDGISITYDEMQNRFGNVIGRPHFAEVLVENGRALSVQDAFDRYLLNGRRYGFLRRTIPMERCIELINDAGGVAVIAHPFEYSYDKNSLFELIHSCVKCGVKGIECRHPKHDYGQMTYLENICDEMNLIKTGGSDYHGAVKQGISLGSGIGTLIIPYEWLDSIKSKR